MQLHLVIEEGSRSSDTSSSSPMADMLPGTSTSGAMDGAAKENAAVMTDAQKKKRGRPPLSAVNASTQATPSTASKRKADARHSLDPSTAKKAAHTPKSKKRESNGQKENAPDSERKKKMDKKEKTEDTLKAVPKTKNQPSIIEKEQTPDVPLTVAIYNYMLPKKNLVDRQIDVEVESRKHETLEDAVAQVSRDVEDAKRRKAVNEEWKVDYLIAAVSKHKRKIVCKYGTYARPSFVEIPSWFIPTTPEYIDFWSRSELLDKVEVFLIDFYGKKRYRRLYPHRFAPNEPGYSESAFVTNQITLHKHRVRAAEWRVRHETDKVNQPFIWYEDWTNLTDGDVPHFKYTNSLVPSNKVKSALSKNDDYGAIKCKSSVCEKEPGTSCSSFLNNKDKNRECKCKITKAKGAIDKSPVECTNECDCDPVECGNRVIQKGRQMELLIFKDWLKGWTCRALTIINKGDYIGEYTGEVLTTHESYQRDQQSYYMEMPNVREIEDPDEKGKKRHQKLVIDGFGYGNETRFISHSCSPNLELITAYVERHGGWYCRMVFIAKRTIVIGEELTFDYFPCVKYEEKETNYSHILEQCACGADRCKFPQRTEAELANLRALDLATRNVKIQKVLEDGDSWNEGSEDESREGKDEKREKAMKSRKKRSELRDAMKERQLQKNDEELLADALEKSERREEEGENSDEE